MISRRSLLVGASAGALAAPAALHVGSQTNAWPIDPAKLDSLLGVLSALKELGFAGYETSFRNLQSSFAAASSARARLEKYGLRFFGIHIFLLQYDPDTSVAPWDLLQIVADGGRALGAERLIVSGASTPDAAPLARKAKALDRIARYCRDRGMGFGYHNHDAEFRNDRFQIDGLLQQTDPALVHLVLDAGHAMEGGANVAEFFTRHASRIDGIHLRDAKQGREVPLGEGDFDWRPLAAAIRTARWNGWILTEEERLSGEKPGERAVRPARAAIRRVFGV